MKMLQRIFNKLSSLGLTAFIPDKLYLKIRFYLEVGRKLNLKSPQTYNDKLQWLKLHEKNPQYTQMVDKYEVREYIKEKIGEEYLIPILGVWESADEIDFDKLPNQFVLKCTHDSGGLVICKNKETLDIEATKIKLQKCLKRNFYKIGREWPYKNVKPRIIAEKFMVDESGTDLKDYKFYCFNGEPKVLLISSDRPHNTKMDFFDAEFNHLNIKRAYPNSDKEILKPKSFDKMLELSKKLSENLIHVRVDLYDVDGHIFFGEITFFPASGFTPFVPPEWDYTFGDWLKLDK